MNLPGYDAWKTTDPYDDRYDRDEAAEELRTWEAEMNEADDPCTPEDWED